MAFFPRKKDFSENVLGSKLVCFVGIGNQKSTRFLFWKLDNAASSNFFNKLFDKANESATPKGFVHAFAVDEIKIPFLEAR